MQRVILSLLAAGAWMAASPALAGGGSSVGPANPASVFCVNNGGTLVLLEEAAGQVGFCQLDRALIEEWSLYRSTGGRTTMASLAFLQRAGSGERDEVVDEDLVDLPNPAAVNCQRVGGSLKLLRDRAGNDLGICKFADNSQIEEWTLLRGPAEAGNRRLAQLLK